MNDHDQRWMTRALELAGRADYRTSPNPMVGAVVLDAEGRLAGEGYHRAKGEPHAEQMALAVAGARARGGTIYVNLEPCPHVHRSPACADAIVAAGIGRAVIAIEDPDQRVRGAGVQRLRESGVEVTMGVEAAAARRLDEFYIVHRLTGRPFVSLKFAMSLDGKIATRTGHSRWITGEAARAHGHQLRHSHDAILVGVNTVIEDDPQLTTRIEGRADARQPLRVVLDSRLRIPRSARILDGRTLIATATTCSSPIDGAELVQLNAGPDGRVPIAGLLDELGRRGILSLLVEGGGETHAAFLAAGLVDKVYAYIAPIIIGGSTAPGPVAGTGIGDLNSALRMRDTTVTSLGDDTLISGYVGVHRDS